MRPYRDPMWGARLPTPWPVWQKAASLKYLWRKRWLRLGILFLPALLWALYCFLIATDRYESEAQFVVRTSARPEVSGGIAFLVQLGLAKSQDDSFIVQEYMGSRDAIDQLRERLPLAQIFDPPEADFLARFPSILYRNNSERFFKYFRQMVTVTHVEKSGIATLRVQAFRPGDAQLVAKTLLTLGEELINRLNERLQTDAIAVSKVDLQKAQERLVEAQAALTDFRNKELILDPGKNAVALAELIGQLSAELASTQAQIIEMRSSSGGSPLLLTLQRKAVALQEQIDRERARIAADTGGLATRIAAYERLTLEREFANKMTKAAEAELQRSRAEASRQLLYLERITEPNLADYSTQPKRFQSALTVFAANFLLALVGWLIFSGVREHAP
jgi:capsular polysaccharide transport system permease protein